MPAKKAAVSGSLLVDAAVAYFAALALGATTTIPVATT